MNRASRRKLGVTEKPEPTYTIKISELHNMVLQAAEKEIERVIINTTGMYGDLQGIIGASLPTIKSLELPSGEEEEEIEAEAE